MLPVNDVLREVSTDYNCYMQQKLLQGFYIVLNVLREKVEISMVWHSRVQNSCIFYDHRCECA